MLKALRNRRKSAKGEAAPARDATAPLQPVRVDWPHYVIGDVHGRMDLLQALSQQIIEDARARPGMGAARIVYLGDYVDRGDASAQVLDHVYRLNLAQPERHICLKGNHEAMMLDFLNDPAARGARWLRHGGLQTLASFGIGGLTERAAPEEILDASEALHAALPEGVIAWLDGLPTLHITGNLVCVHAALDPDLPPEASPERSRLWGQKDFYRDARNDGYWVIHGHTIVDEAGPTPNGRLELDTGAYATGRLTAAGFNDVDVWLLST